MIANRTTEDLVDERDFLVQRMRDEHVRAGTYRDIGISSQAMLLYALGTGSRPKVPGRFTRGDGCRFWFGDECGQCYPHDEDDLGRCERTYESAPLHLQVRMLPVLEEFRAWVLEGKNRYGEVQL